MSWECPQCGDKFDSLKGLGSHQALAHEEFIPPVTENRLRELYWEDGLSLRDVADELDVSDNSVRSWMDHYGIERPSRAESVRVNRAGFRTDARGYEVWHTSHGQTHIRLTVHRLLAIANDADPRSVFDGDHHVHHRNGVPWDNRPDNVELLTLGEHRRVHAKERAEDPNSNFGNGTPANSRQAD